MQEIFIKLRFKFIQLEKKLKQKSGIPEGETWDYVFDGLFDKMAILHQEPEAKADISKRVVEGMTTGKLYWIEVILASFIATLGLLQNSVAVILGAMLIAPLLRPIQGLAYAISVGRVKLFWKSSKLLIFSILVSVFIPWTLLYLLPNAETTAEILARTQPNLLDLLIAIFSAFIAILAHAYKRLHESIAGVAMATALMPPLVVVGLELYWGNLNLAFSAGALFFTNLVAILVVGVLMFILYGFNPHREQAKSSLGKILFLLFTIFFLWGIFSYNLEKIQDQRVIEKETSQELETILKNLLPGTKIKNLEIRPEEKKYIVEGDLYIPENLKFTRGKLKMIQKELSSGISEDFSLEFDVVRTVIFETESKEKIENKKFP